MGGIVLGIDIGHDAIKVVGLTVGRKPRLIGCASAPVNAQLIGREQANDPAPVSKALKAALAAAAPKKLSPGVGVLALSESVLFRKVLELPHIPDDNERRDAISVEAAEYLPQPIDEMELDYQVLGSSADGITEQVMVVAVSRSLVELYNQAFSDAGIQLEAIDAKPSSLGRLLVPKASKEAVLILDIGSELSTVSMHHAGLCQVTSTVNVGGNCIKDPATGEVDADREDAQIAHLVEELLEEVAHVIKFYTNRSLNAQPVKEILLAGGGSHLKNLKQQLASGLELPVSEAKPPLILPAFCDRRYNGALGAALYQKYGRA